MSSSQKFMVAFVVICIGVGSFTAYALYREDFRQTAVWDKAVACEQGEDDAVLYGMGAVGWMLLVNFTIATLGTGLIAWLVAARALPLLIMCAGLLAGIVVGGISYAWMFPVTTAATLGVLMSIAAYGTVGKRRRRHSRHSGARCCG